MKHLVHVMIHLVRVLVKLLQQDQHCSHDLHIRESWKKIVQTTILILLAFVINYYYYLWTKSENLKSVSTTVEYGSASLSSSSSSSSKGTHITVTYSTISFRKLHRNIFLLHSFLPDSWLRRLSTFSSRCFPRLSATFSSSITENRNEWIFFTTHLSKRVSGGGWNKSRVSPHAKKYTRSKKREFGLETP